MRSSFEPGFSGRDCISELVSAGVPHFRFAATLAFAADAVISTQAHKFGSVVNPFASELRSHIGKIDVAGFLISDIDANIAASLAPTIIIGNRLAAAGRRKTHAGVEMNVLHD